MESASMFKEPFPGFFSIFSNGWLNMPRVSAENILLGVVTGLLTFTVTFLRELNGNIEKLNVQMAQVIDRMAVSTETLKNHEIRILELERKQ